MLLLLLHLALRKITRIENHSRNCSWYVCPTSTQKSYDGENLVQLFPDNKLQLSAINLHSLLLSHPSGILHLQKFIKINIPPLPITEGYKESSYHTEPEYVQNIHVHLESIFSPKRLHNPI